MIRSLSVFAAITATALLASGCEPTMPMSVEYAFGPGVKYEATDSTFDWSPEKMAALKEVQAQNPPLHTLIMETVENEMASKGYARRTDGQADLHVGHGVSRRDTADPWTMEPLTEGTLRVELLDPQTGNLIYRGIATIKVDRAADPEQRKTTIRDAVRRMLEKFPKAGSTTKP